MPNVKKWSRGKNHTFTEGLMDAWTKEIRKNPPLRPCGRWYANGATLTEPGGLGLRVTPTRARYVVFAACEGKKYVWPIRGGDRDLMTLQEARAKAAKIRLDAERGIPYDRQLDGGATIQSLVSLYLPEYAVDKRPHTVKARRHHLHAICEGRGGATSFAGIGYLPLGQLDVKRVQAIGLWYTSRRQVGAERLAYYALSGLLKWAKTRGLPSREDLLACWHPPKSGRRKGILELTELRLVRDGLLEFGRDPKKSLGTRLSALGLLLKSYTAARTTEIERLYRREIRLSASELLIAEHKTIKKSGEARRVPLTERAKAVIQLILELAPESPYLLPHPKDPSTHHRIRHKAWNAVCQKIGADISTLGGPGVLRRSVLTYISREAGVKKAQQAAGHTNLSTTERYLEDASFGDVLGAFADFERKIAKDVACGVCKRVGSTNTLGRHRFKAMIGNVVADATVWYCRESATCQRRALMEAEPFELAEQTAT